MKPIEEQLRETIGLDAASVGPSLIQRTVRHRMRSLGLKRPEDYLRFLEQSRAEWHELVESVVVAETWFFRDPEPIAAFARLARERWLPAHTATPLRLLSVPCSSGEEPFSLVMALLDAGVPADRFQVEALDISTRALARAVRGVYRRNSFRGQDLAFRTRYFRPITDGFVLDPAVRRCVRFYQGNLLSDDLQIDQAGYDFIFCRNLLIYFDPLMQRKALNKLERLLAPDGLLFVGPVERPLAIKYGFVTASLPMSVACRKPGHGAGRQRLPGPPPQPGESESVFPSSARPARGELLGASRKAAPLSGDNLERARRLADAGCLEQAAEICEAHLRQSRGSAQAYYLLGLVREATGAPGAMDCYRKALYLEPNHYESLLQMALLLQKNGDTARARTFKTRAQRIQTKM
jgi:chemotaxis protein methyltransferase WspC